jgi:hypothetical protein
VATPTDIQRAGGRPQRIALGLVGLLLCVAVIAVAVALLRDEESAGVASHAEPAVLGDIDGDGVRRIVMTQHATERLELETALVARSGRGTVVPYSALIYDPDGKTWVYTSPKPLEFLRAPVEVARIEGTFAYLSDGPPDGTPVVTRGGAEVYGTEFEVGH